MKNLFLALVATILFSGGAFAFIEKPLNSNYLECELKENSSIENELLIEISISIDWGRKSRDCRGFGICEITIDINIPSLIFRASSYNGRLLLNFGEETKNEVVNYFDGNSIILEEDFVLPRELTSELELKEGYTIKAGKYSFDIEIKDQYQVVM